MTMGKRIKEYRTQSKLSQEKVAELVGVSRQAVTKWEADLSAPTTDNLFKLAEIFGTTVDALITDVPDQNSVAKLVYQMIREDEEHKKAAVQEKWRLRLRDMLGVMVCYLIVFLLCKILWADHENLSLMGWLENTFYEFHTPFLFWLLHTRFFWYAALFSIIAALVGLRRLSITTIAGFIIGLPLGEYLGGIPGLVPEKMHFGYEIWTFIFIGSIVFGIWLQFFKPEDLTLKSGKMKCWLLIFGLYIIAVIPLVLFSIPESYF